MRKRTIMAQAIVFDSTVCLLDEPLAGLDHATHALALQVIANLRQPNWIVLFVEHDLDAVDAVADRVLLMDQGRIVADGRPQEVRASRMFSETFLQANSILVVAHATASLGTRPCSGRSIFAFDPGRSLRCSPRANQLCCVASRV
jgi:ABC-type Mn2+/Zn2+ transport system ATPase subunit